ncbi:ATP-binding protein, partial [Neobittarella massiliensis]
MPENIKQENRAYDGEQIQVLEGLEAVRKRPGMYIGSTGSRGLHHLVYEIVDNAIDEAMAGYCDRIGVEILPGNCIRVTDNGRGIPVSIQPKMGIPAVTVVFTVLHAGGKFGGGGYKVSAGLHGVGASVVNALSEYLEVWVRKEGKIYYQRFEKGVAIGDLAVIGDCGADESGTTVLFHPDSEVFEDIQFEFDDLASRLREQSFLNAGVKIVLEDKRDEEDPITEVMHYEGGIRSFVEYIHKKKGLDVVHPDVIYLSGQKEDAMVEVALQYNDSYNEVMLSFANDVHTTDGGTHEQGFKAALTRVFNEYGRKNGILKDADKNLSGEDVREGLTTIISVKVTEAQFEGQTKARLGNTEIRSMVDSLVYDKLSTYFEENPATVKLIFDKALTAARAREAA